MDKKQIREILLRQFKIGCKVAETILQLHICSKNS